MDLAGEADAGVRRLRDCLKEGLVDQGEEAGFGALAFRDPSRGLILIPDESFQEAIGDRDSDEVLRELANQRYFPVGDGRTLNTWETWWIGGMRLSGWIVRGSILHKRGPSPED